LAGRKCDRGGASTQEDPIGVAGGINLYQFNGNNPAMFTDPFGLMGCDPKKDKDCELVAQVTAGATAGTKGAGKLGSIVGFKWQAGLTAEAGTRQTVDLAKRKVENTKVGVVKVGGSVEITVLGGSFGVRIGYDSEDSGKLFNVKSNPDADGTVETEGMIPLVGIIGPSGSYRLNPAGAYLATQPGMQQP
jgi:uncharacterized protein RhaS with RHS repeats